MPSCKRARISSASLIAAARRGTKSSMRKERQYIRCKCRSRIEGRNRRRRVLRECDKRGASCSHSRVSKSVRSCASPPHRLPVFSFLLAPASECRRPTSLRSVFALMGRGCERERRGIVIRDSNKCMNVVRHVTSSRQFHSNHYNSDVLSTRHKTVTKIANKEHV